MPKPRTSLAHSRQVPSRIVVTGGAAPRRSPYRKQRAGDLLAGRAIGLIMREISRAAGAIILADGVEPNGIVEEGVIVRKRARIEGGEVLAFGSGCRTPIEEEDRVLADHGFGKRMRQREESPMPRAHGHARVHMMPHRPGRHDIEHCNLREASRVIECEAIADPAAAVMTGETHASV